MAKSPPKGAIRGKRASRQTPSARPGGICREATGGGGAARVGCTPPKAVSCSAPGMNESRRKSGSASSSLFLLACLAPSSRGLGRRPLKAVTPVRIRSGLRDLSRGKKNWSNSSYLVLFLVSVICPWIYCRAKAARAETSSVVRFPCRGYSSVIRWTSSSAVEAAATLSRKSRMYARVP